MSTRQPAGQLTRRGFLGSSGTLALVSQSLSPAALLTSHPVAAAEAGPRSDDYLEVAEQTARWIRSAQVAKDAGIAWLADPDHPGSATVGPDNTIYSGSAGTVLFFLELAAATGNQSYLDDAKRGADYLAASWKRLPGRQGASLLQDRGLSFDQGVAGTAFTLAETWKATKVPAYRDAALQATRALADSAVAAGDGVEWLPSPAVGLGGGIVLYLLYAAHTFNQDDLLQLATRAGHRIVQLGQPDPRGGQLDSPSSWRPPKPGPGTSRVLQRCRATPRSSTTASRIFSTFIISVTATVPQAPRGCSISFTR